MLDLVSTRTTDPHTRGCAQLLAAIIAQAIRDASMEPTPNEVRAYANQNMQARQALRFLFSTRSLFPLYAELIGSSAETIRAGLLGYKKLPLTNGHYNTAQRRSLQWRVAADMAQPESRRAVNAPPTDVDCADDDTEDAAAAAPQATAAH